MSKTSMGLGAAAAAIGSAAVAAGLLYANKRRKGSSEGAGDRPPSAQGDTIPSGEAPQTD